MIDTNDLLGKAKASQDPAVLDQVYAGLSKFSWPYIQQVLLELVANSSTSFETLHSIYARLLATKNSKLDGWDEVALALAKCDGMSRNDLIEISEGSLGVDYMPHAHITLSKLRK